MKAATLACFLVVFLALVQVYDAREITGGMRFGETVFACTLLHEDAIMISFAAPHLDQILVLYTVAS